jgi:release factor glutamine methyltransferase
MNGQLISSPQTIQEILVNATRVLGTSMNYRKARLEAELLLAHSLEISRAMLLARLTDPVEVAVAAQFGANVARRSRQEPLAYVMGHREFYGLNLMVDRRVLIPRYETELMVQIALDRARRVAQPVVVDIGTGSGAIALSLGHHLTSAHIYATDISHEALTVAQINASRLHLDRVRFLESDLLIRLDEPFDLLIANLPYIPSARYDDLPREIREFEPRIALDGGFDGLSAMRRLLTQLKERSRRGSVALFEISEEQGDEAIRLVRRELPLALARVHRDLEGLDRVIEINLHPG